MKTIADLWNDYRAKVMPVKVQPVQFTETRRAFYAGCETALLLLSELAGGDEISEEEGVRRLQTLHDECKRFAGMVGKGGF